nr:tyrosine-protein phosphatase [Lentilactobacillus parafarraginis]
MTVSLTNFRSLGGYPVANGHIRDGLLFRGGQLDDLSGNQINYLQRDLKITRIIDFRSLMNESSSQTASGSRLSISRLMF